MADNVRLLLQATGLSEGGGIIVWRVGVLSRGQAKRAGGGGSVQEVQLLEQLQLESTFDVGSIRPDPPATYSDHFEVAQRLFEKSGSVAEACQSSYQGPPAMELRQYTLCANERMAWFTVPLDTRAQPVLTGIGALLQARTQAAATALRSAAAGRLEQCLSVYKPGTGIKLGPLPSETYDPTNADTRDHRVNATHLAATTGCYRRRYKFCFVYRTVLRRPN